MDAHVTSASGADWGDFGDDEAHGNREKRYSSGWLNSMTAMDQDADQEVGSSTTGYATIPEVKYAPWTAENVGNLQQPAATGSNEYMLPTAPPLVTGTAPTFKFGWSHPQSSGFGIPMASGQYIPYQHQPSPSATIPIKSLSCKQLGLMENMKSQYEAMLMQKDAELASANWKISDLSSKIQDYEALMRKQIESLTNELKKAVNLKENRGQLQPVDEMSKVITAIQNQNKRMEHLENLFLSRTSKLETLEKMFESVQDLVDVSKQMNHFVVLDEKLDALKGVPGSVNAIDENLKKLSQTMEDRFENMEKLMKVRMGQLSDSHDRTMQGVFKQQKKHRVRIAQCFTKQCHQITQALAKKKRRLPDK